MLNGRNLCLDTMSEIYNLLMDYCDHEFWDFNAHDPIPNSIYVLGRQQIVEAKDKVRALSNDPRFVMVFDNSAEGSRTLMDMCERVLAINDLIDSKRLLVVTGGDLPRPGPFILHEHFLTCVLDYEENLQEISRASAIFSKTAKPYHFLFLNGRSRPHRKYLFEKFRHLGLLDRALWSMLDGRKTELRDFDLNIDGTNMMATNNPIKHLDATYEVPRYQNYQRTSDYKHQFIKNELFANEWGEIYLQAAPFVDSYFSLVTETVYEIPSSFRTEKIAKVLAIGHPWICAANAGFYRDLRNIGFRTFDTIIDEDFDQIDNHQDRMDRIISIVGDLCKQDLKAFLQACQPVCKYNQQFLAEFIQQHRAEFPKRFQLFLDTHARS